MKPYTYLLVDFLTIVVCFIFSFDKRIRFYKHFGAFFKAVVLTGVFFIAWDVWFTQEGVWWFSTDYTLGKAIFGLPLEEWLFFLCIPFSCLFTYFCLDTFFNLNWANTLNKGIVWGTTIGCLTVAVLYDEKMYTFITACVTAVTVLYLFYVDKADWIGKGSLVYTILMLGFFPVNGILTGTGLETPIVNYNPNEILNIRILTIPIEDFVYGYAQFMLNLHFFKLFQKDSSRDTSRVSKQIV